VIRLAFSRPTRDDEEFKALLQTFRSVGYEGLQLKFGQYSRYLANPEQACEDWRDIFPEADLSLIVGCDLTKEGATLLRDTIRLASRIGSARVVFCQARERSSVSREDIRTFAGTLSEIGREARQLGTALSLHHHFNQPVMHRDDMRVFFDHVSPGDVGLTVDTAHLVKSGIWDIAGVIREFAPVIDNFHLKDFDGKRREFWVLGEGDLDFAPVFSSIREIGYRGWISADEESGSDLGRGMRECYELMKTGLG
jgi:inosose dehydratase